jgi:hypothetical protein
VRYLANKRGRCDRHSTILCRLCVDYLFVFPPVSSCSRVVALGWGAGLSNLDAGALAGKVRTVVLSFPQALGGSGGLVWEEVRGVFVHSSM